MSTTFTIAPLLVTALVAFVLPVLVGAVTKAQARTGVKQTVMIVLSGVAALLNTSLTIEGAAVFSGETLFLWALQVFVTIASYHGLYRPHDLDAHVLPEIGVGRPVIDARSFEKG